MRRQVVFKNVMDDSLTIIPILFQAVLRVVLGSIHYDKQLQCITYQDNIRSPMYFTTRTTWENTANTLLIFSASKREEICTWYNIQANQDE